MLLFHQQIPLTKGNCNISSRMIYGKGKTELRDVPVPSSDGDILIEIKRRPSAEAMFTLRRHHGRPRRISYGIATTNSPASLQKQNVRPFWKNRATGSCRNTGYACGRCPACQSGNFVGCEHRETLGCSMDGGFTKYEDSRTDSAPLSKLYVHIPDNLSFERPQYWSSQQRIRA